MKEGQRVLDETEERSTSFRFPTDVEITPPHGSKIGSPSTDGNKAVPLVESAPTPTPPSSETPGEVIEGELSPGMVLFGKYVLIKQLGKGGMGEVWLVQHQTLGLERALKMILSGIAIDQQIRSRFRREAQIMARFSEHRNAVQVHDSKVAANAAFIEMEFVRGQDFTQFLKPGVPMPLDWVARILVQLCDVLQTAHDLGIVHRDLSPSNLMLVDGRPPGREHLKVLDFGIAKIVRPEVAGTQDTENLTAQDAFVGKWAYASPEQLQGQAIDGRSDLYSVGVILYELLTGQRPFTGAKLVVMSAHFTLPPRPFEEVNPRCCVPAEVERVVLRTLSKKPEDRPQCARDLADEFLAALTSVPDFTPEFTTDGPQRGDSPSRVPRTATLPDTDSTRTPSSRPGVTPLPSTGRGTSPSRTIEATEGYAPEPVRPPSSASGPHVTPITARSASEVRTRETLGPTIPTQDALRPPKPRNTIFITVLGAMLAVACIGAATVGYFKWARKSGSSEGAIADYPANVRDQIKVWNRERYFVAPNSTKTSDSGWPMELVRKFGDAYVRYTWHAMPDRPDGLYFPEGYEPSTDLAEDGWPRKLMRGDVEFIRIPGGQFRMGPKTMDPKDAEFDRVGPAHEVTLDGYYLQKYEVTNGEMARYLGTGPKPPKWMGYYQNLRLNFPTEADKYPAVYINWTVACQFAFEHGGQLPTEAQWEFAARSGNRSVDWVWGDRGHDQVIQGKAHVNDSEKLSPVPGGHFPEFDRTEHGVMDMAGNVREWTRDLFKRYSPETAINPDGFPEDALQSQGPFAIRGGSFNTSPDEAGTRCRGAEQKAGEEAADLGFRLVIECPSRPIRPR